MNITTSATATVQKAFLAAPGEDFLVKVDAGSAAGIRAYTGRPITVDNVPTADTAGLLIIAADGIVRLPGHQQIWMIGTGTNLTAATFGIMAVEAERR